MANESIVHVACGCGKLQKQMSGGVLWKKVFLEISQNLQENTCAWVSFLIKLIKKETLAHVFSCEFYEISKSALFTEHLRTTASEACI